MVPLPIQLHGLWVGEATGPVRVAMVCAAYSVQSEDTQLGDLFGAIRWTETNSFADIKGTWDRRDGVVLVAQ